MKGKLTLVLLLLIHTELNWRERQTAFSSSDVTISFIIEHNKGDIELDIWSLSFKYLLYIPRFYYYNLNFLNNDDKYYKNL